MKILHIIPDLTIGGAQKLLENLLPLLKDGHEIEVIVFSKKNTEIESYIEQKGIKIISLNMGARSPKAIFKLRHHIKQTDVIHCHLFPAHYYTVFSNMGVKNPVVFTEHSTNNKRRNHNWLRPLEKFIYGRIHKVVGISQATITNLAKWLRMPKDSSKFVLIENGIDIEKYQSGKKLDPITTFGRSGKPIIMVSRFTEAKDYETVVRAIPEIEDPELYFVFVGDGEKRKDIENLASKLGIKDKILFLGNRTDIPLLLRSSFLGIQSSNWEGFGLTAVEIMAAGLPLIASDVEGLRDVARNAGELFKKGNFKELASIINKINKDEVLYNDLSLKSLRKAEQYSILKTADQYLALYKSLLADKREL